MRIGVLGPIQLLDGSRTILLAGQRQRALLAALTLDHGKVVPVDRLVDVLWDAEPPATARAKVQAHVSALRRVLGYGAGPDRGPLLTIPPGYSLTLSGISLDLAEFARLSAQGRQAASVGQWTAASAVFEAALTLWRGPAYADVISHAIRAAAVPLDESRLLAVEAKAEADLELGRNETVVAQLYDQVTRHPLRERLRVQLMLALYQRGSRADALAVYRNGRRAMIDELGLEPSLPLRRLHQRMLADEPASQLNAASEGKSAGAREPHPVAQRGPAPAAR